MPRKTKRTQITSPEKMAQINKNNLQLKEDFLLYLQSIQRSPGTIAGYESDLNIVFTYVLDNLDNKDFQTISKRDLIRLQNWMVQQELSPARIRRLKAAISSLSNYCENILSDDDPEFEGFRSIVRKIENPPLAPVREKTIIEEETLEKALDSLVERKRYDLACMLALAMCSGRRKSELVLFKTSYFDDSNLIYGGSMYKTPEKIKTKGRGNGKFIHCYTLSGQFKPYLELWLKEREVRGISDSEWLFPSGRDSRDHISVATMDAWADTLSRVMGIDFYWHSLRHFFTTKLSRSGIPDGAIAKLISWESVDMVSVYNDVSDDEMLERYFDADGIKAVEAKSLSSL